MCSLLPIFMLVSVFGSDQQFLNLVRRIDDDRDVLELLKNESEIMAVLKNTEINSGDFRYHYLSMLKNDIDRIKRFNMADYMRVYKYNSIKSSNKKNGKVNPQKNDGNNELEVCCNELAEIFGKCSYVGLATVTDLLAQKITMFPDEDFSVSIEAEIARFEKSGWKGSPMLSQLYMVKCRNLMNLKSYELAYQASIIVKKMREKICPDKKDQIHLGPISYEMQSLCFLEKYNAVIEIGKKIPSELLDGSDRKYLSSISRIYSSLATSYLKTGKIELSSAYQEIALGKMYQCFLDRDYPAVREQAVKLRDILEIKGDALEMRRIEERFNIKPASK